LTLLGLLAPALASAEVMPKPQRERARSRDARYVELYVPDFGTG
jgi:hypothetical protein